MPELDYALLCDYVRAEHGLAHIVGAGIDTVLARSVPTGRNIGVLVRLRLEDDDFDRPLALTVRFQTEAGEALAEVNAHGVASRPTDVSADWPSSALVAVNFGLFFPEFGRYGIVVEVGGRPLRTLDLRVVPFAET
jgi:hypothetical protein